MVWKQKPTWPTVSFLGRLKSKEFLLNPIIRPWVQSFKDYFQHNFMLHWFVTTVIGWKIIGWPIRQLKNKHDIHLKWNFVYRIVATSKIYWTLMRRGWHFSMADKTSLLLLKMIGRFIFQHSSLDCTIH